MKYTIQNRDNTVNNLRRVAVRPQEDQINEMGSVNILSPTDGTVGFAVDGSITWGAIDGYSRYRIIIKRQSNESVVVNETVSGTSYTPSFDATTGYDIQVKTARDIPKPEIVTEITGVVISAGSQVEVNNTLTLVGEVQGTGDYVTAGTWTRTTGTMAFTVSGNEIIISAGADGDSSTFVFAADDGTSAQRVVTTIAENTYVPVDSLQGDFDALQALYNSTQGQDIPTLSRSAISGTITSSTSSYTVTGTGTSFTTELTAGDKIWIYTPNVVNSEAVKLIGFVDTIIDDTTLTLKNIQGNPAEAIISVSGAIGYKINGLESHTNIASYPFLYMIDGEIYYLQHDTKNDQFSQYKLANWHNAGAPWADKTGWTDMTPQTMGDAVGVEVDANGRVISLDMWRVRFRDNGARSDGYYGNNLCGELPVEINNLRLQYCALKQNFFIGRIPNISNWNQCTELSLGGQDQYLRHTDADRSQWHENNHWAHPDGVGKRVVATNRFKDVIPDLSGFTNLTMIEMRHQFLEGPIPAWTNMPSLTGIFIDVPKDIPTNSIKGSSLPDSWGDLTNTIFFNIAGLGLEGTFPQTIDDNWSNLSNIFFSGNFFYGKCPQFLNSRDKRYVSLNNNNFGKYPPGTVMPNGETAGTDDLLPEADRQFPSGYFNGDNSELNKWQIGNLNFMGEIPEMTEDNTTPIYPPTYPISRYNYRVAAPGVGRNPFTGVIPYWLQTQISMQTWYSVGCHFSGPFPEEIAKQNNQKTMYIIGNEHTGTFPNINWGRRKNPWIYLGANHFEGGIPPKWITIFVETSSDFDWAPAPNPDGSENFYEFTGTGATLTWDAVPNIATYEVLIYEQYLNHENKIRYRVVQEERWMESEELVVSGLPSKTYYWKVRGLKWVDDLGRVSVAGNDLSGPIPDWGLNVASYYYGLNFNNNRFTYKDVAGVYSAYKTHMGDGFRVDNQKPFYVPQNIFNVNVGDQVIIDLSEQDTAGNVYQWQKNGVEMSDTANVTGTGTHTLTIASAELSDDNNYKLVITNSNYPSMGTIQSETIDVNVT